MTIHETRTHLSPADVVERARTFFTVGGAPRGVPGTGRGGTPVARNGGGRDRSRGAAAGGLHAGPGNGLARSASPDAVPDHARFPLGDRADDAPPWPSRDTGGADEHLPPWHRRPSRRIAAAYWARAAGGPNGCVRRGSSPAAGPPGKRPPQPRVGRLPTVDAAVHRSPRVSAGVTFITRGRLGSAAFNAGLDRPAR